MLPSAEQIWCCAKRLRLGVAVAVGTCGGVGIYCINGLMNSNPASFSQVQYHNTLVSGLVGSVALSVAPWYVIATRCTPQTKTAAETTASAMQNLMMVILLQQMSKQKDTSSENLNDQGGSPSKKNE